MLCSCTRRAETVTKAAANRRVAAWGRRQKHGPRGLCQKLEWFSWNEFSSIYSGGTTALWALYPPLHLLPASPLWLQQLLLSLPLLRALDSRPRCSGCWHLLSAWCTSLRPCGVTLISGQLLYPWIQLEIDSASNTQPSLHCLSSPGWTFRAFWSSSCHVWSPCW